MKRFIGIIVLAMVIVFPIAAGGSAEKKKQGVTEQNTFELEPTPLFIIEDADNDDDYASLSEYDYVIDERGERFLFRATYPFMRSANICIISIGYSDEGNLYEEDILVSHDVGSTFVVRTHISETIPDRGISYTNENGERRYYYILYSGENGSVKLVEFQNKP